MSLLERQLIYRHDLDPRLDWKLMGQNDLLRLPAIQLRDRIDLILRGTKPNIGVLA